MSLRDIFYRYTAPLCDFISARPGVASRPCQGRVEEGKGFEPLIPETGIAVFKTASLDHSDTPPRVHSVLTLNTAAVKHFTSAPQRQSHIIPSQRESLWPSPLQASDAVTALVHRHPGERAVYDKTY